MIHYSETVTDMHAVNGSCLNNNRTKQGPIVMVAADNANFD